MKLPIIKSFKEFESIMEQLEKQGFSIHNYERGHYAKIDMIFQNANNLNIDYPAELPRELYREVKGRKEDYVLLQKQAEKYFAGFDESDKIKELLRNNFIEASIELHSSLSDPPDKKEEHQKILSDYELSKEEHDGYYYRLYDLSGNSLKIRHGRSFEELIQRTLAKGFKLEASVIGVWQVSAGVGYKFYKNGKIEIKHPKLENLKTWYRKSILSRGGDGVKKEL